MDDKKGCAQKSLRRQAEDMVKKHETNDLPYGSRVEIPSLVHELRVHHVELELQNEELRIAQFQLAISQARYYSLFNQAPIGYVATNASGLIQEANVACAKLFGMTRDQLKGERLNRFVYRDDQDIYYLHYKALIEAQAPQALETRMVNRQGHRFWADVRMSASQCPESGKNVYLMMILDIGNRKEVEEELRASQDRYRTMTKRLQAEDTRKNAFIGMLSHEIRNPLTAISMGLQLLDRVEPTSDKAQMSKGIMQRQVVQLSRIVDDLLDITRLQQNKIVLKKAYLELNQLVCQVIDNYLPLFEEKGLHLHSTVSNTPLHVHGDAARLNQVIGNILHNAVKFTPQGGAQVSLSPDARHQLAVLQVSDTGIGLDPHIKPHLFEPFQQADTSLHHSEGGLGLGLGLVKGLIELHGGQVSAYSEGLGQGSTFVIILPLKTGDVMETSPASTPSYIPRAGQQVLVIEDLPDVANLIKSLLENEGYDVFVAYNGKEGISQAQLRHPHIILCDIGLPDIDGLEVARTLRKDAQFEDTYLVSLSGYGRDHDLEQAKEAGFDVQLVKPVTLSVLRKALGQSEKK